jgi:hypothetical protein
MGRLRTGELVAGAGGILLLVALWLPWYAVDLPLPVPAAVARHARSLPELTAWDAFAIVDVLLAAFALLALALALVTAVARGPAKPVALAVVTAGAAPIATLLVLVRLAFHPSAHELLRYGAWVGLVAVLLAGGGAWLALKDESTPGAVAPSIPPRPPPPA